MSLIIKTATRSFDTTCTLQSYLTYNQMTSPQVADVMRYVEQRKLSTLIVSGVKYGKDISPSKTRTKIPEIPKDKKVGTTGYRHKIMGRIQRASVINAQVGTSGADGSFMLRMADNQLYPGLIVRFYDDTKARVQQGPLSTGGAGSGYNYLFKTLNGTTFNYATAVTPMGTVKRIFGGYGIYGEASKRGYSNAYYPDEYINHATIQRKGFSMSGDALATVVTVDVNGTKGWYFERERQMDGQFLLENEYEAWDGVSTLRDQYGNLTRIPSIEDLEAGSNGIISGDGFLTQIEDGNVSTGSGPGGWATMDDHMDMVRTLSKHSQVDPASGSQRFVVVCSTEAYEKAQEELLEYWITKYNGSHQVNGSELGDIQVGANFDTFKLGNRLVTFCENSMWGDDVWFGHQMCDDGVPLRAKLYAYFDISTQNVVNRQNMEMLSVSANGVDRNMIKKVFNGMTGMGGFDAMSPIDAINVEQLKHDMKVVYNPKACGLIKGLVR